MNKFFSASKWTLLAIPVLGAKGCSGSSGGGGGSTSPSTSITDWLSSSLAAYVPTGTIDTLHHVPLINWFV